MSSEYDFDDLPDIPLVDEADEGGEVEQGAAETPVPSLFFGSVDEFVRKHLRYQYRRTVARPGKGEFRWQAAWWKNEEAISRLEAMWRAWENARQDPATGMSDWWLNHCDRQMQILLSPAGPFAASLDENKPGAPLPYAAPPEGFFSADNQPPDEY